MLAVREFCLEGNVEVDWRIEENEVRRWYHMPWMGSGATGREFIHGLTRERDFAPGELGAAQAKCRQNWAVAFFNPAGGYVLGRIWHAAARGKAPDVSHLPFEAGTVVAKLVFTEATADDTAILAGAPELEANIHTGADTNDGACPDAATSRRSPHQLRPGTIRASMTSTNCFAGPTSARTCRTGSRQPGICPSR